MLICNEKLRALRRQTALTTDERNLRAFGERAERGFLEPYAVSVAGCPEAHAPSRAPIAAYGQQLRTTFRITTFGESHRGGVGVVIDGCPAGSSERAN